MIGIKHTIIFDNHGESMVKFTPAIIKQPGTYEAEDGCLSPTGTQHTKRFQATKAQQQTEEFHARIKTFTGWTAEIIQHEIYHCEGF